MEDRPQDIDALINSVDRYAPANVAILEDYLCATSGQHDLAASLAILKLYQFNPDLVPSPEDTSRPFTIFLILLKTICHNPFGPDFNLAWALLADQLSPTQTASDTLSSYANLSLLSSLLQSRKFRQFWRELDPLLGSSDALQRAYAFISSDFKHALRLNIAQQAVRPLFVSIPATRFNAWLGLSDDKDEEDELAEELEGLGWHFDDKDVRPPKSGAELNGFYENGDGDEETSAAPNSTANGLVNSAISNASLGLEKFSKLFKQSITVA